MNKTDKTVTASAQPENVQQLIAELKKHNPSARFAVAGNGSGIGWYDQARQEFISVIEKAITGQFVFTGGNLPLVNGKTIKRNWQEV